jgi:hypothetical protein
MKSVILLLVVAACAATAHAQKPPKQAPAPASAEAKQDAPPVPLTEDESKQITAMEKEFQQLLGEETLTRQDSLKLAASDKGGYEALGRRVQQIALSMELSRGSYNHWLESVRKRTGCADCYWDGKALIKPPPAPAAPAAAK